MKHFRNITESTARRLDRAMIALAGLRTLEDLEERFITESLKWLPCDCVAWNNWMADWSGMISGRLNDGYHAAFFARIEAFSQTVAHHPVILANQFPASSERILRLSDFESMPRFRNNPLFREVYRHIDSHYQIACSPCLLSDRRVLLTLNRRAMDFTARDMEMLKYLGECLKQVASGIDLNQSLEKTWRELCDLTGKRTGSGAIDSLNGTDLRLLRSLLGRKNVSEISARWKVRRDTVDKRLGAIRERLGMENNRQLLSALAELKPPVADMCKKPV